MIALTPTLSQRERGLFPSPLQGEGQGGGRMTASSEII